jgi:hypothetical protein
MLDLLVGYDCAYETEEHKMSQEPKKQSWWGFRGRTVWDWLPISSAILGAILIPVVIAYGTWRITWQLADLEDKRVQEAQRLETQRAEAEQALAVQRAQDEALQAYLDQMSELMLDKNLLKEEEGSAVRTLARARTIAVLDRLDPERKITVLRFLDESHLIDKDNPVVSLADADFTKVHIDYLDLFLHDVNLKRLV